MRVRLPKTCLHVATIILYELIYIIPVGARRKKRIGFGSKSKNKMEKNKTEKEKGLEEYKLWRQGPLRGHRMIGQWIINRYELLQEDLKVLKIKQQVALNKRYRKKKKAILKEEEKRLS